MKRTIFTILILLANVAYSQTPKAVITGPKESVSGDMVILDASQSQGQKYLWKMIYLPGEEQKSFLPVDGGMKCIFAAGVDSERIFHFVLVVAGDNSNGGPAVDLAVHDVTIRPRGIVVPPVVKPSDPTLPVSPSRVTRVTYLYEKDQNPVPSPVLKGLIQLNGAGSAGVFASYFEVDGTDGTGEVPDQYKVAVNAGKDSLPCLVVESKDGTTKIVKNPKTEEDVIGAVK